MNKRLFSMFSLIIFTLFILTGNVKAEPIENIKEPVVDARNAIAIDCKSKIVLYGKSAYNITPMASTTKIITSLVALKYGNLDKKVEISQKAASIHGSTVGYRKGEEITIRELLYGLMLRSGNDAAIAIAEGVAGSVEEFLKLMNEYACSMGLLDSHFESPHGLDSTNHYTTAYDLALATAKAKEIEEFNKIVSTKDISAETYGFSRDFHNINKILWQIPEANGVKTGYTGQAGKCLVSSVNFKGNDIIIVVINCPQRWKETKKIYDYVAKAYEYKEIAKKDQVLKTVSIKNAIKKAELKAVDDIIIPIKKSEDLKTKIVIPKEIKAPVYVGQDIGRLEVYENDRKVYSNTLKCNNIVSKNKIIKRWFEFYKK